MAVTTVGALVSGVNTAVSIAITGTGVTNYATFTIAAAPDTRDHTLTLQTIGATALPTTLTVDLESSPDGGTTWNKYSTSIALVATTIATVAVIKNIVAGILYRLNPTAWTVGGSTGATVWGTVN